MSGIYAPTDTITPSISFHKSVVVNGGVVAKSASIGNDQCKLVVNDEGVWIQLPSNFDNNGNLSETTYRKYNLGAIVEAIQELNRRTAWMEPDITLSESLMGNDAVANDATIRPGVLYNNVNDHLPGLKRTVPDGNHFRLINTNGDVIRYYSIADEYSDILGDDETLVTAGEDGSLTNLRTMIGDDEVIRGRYISPRILKKDDGSFDILVLDTIDLHTLKLSDGYYVYEVSGSDYKASLKKEVAIETIIDTDGTLIPPVPYIWPISAPTNVSKVIVQDPTDEEERPIYITSFSGMFKGRSDLAGAIVFSGWDFSKITNMSHMFEGCTDITSIDFGKNVLTADINTDYIFEGAAANIEVIFNKELGDIYPAFIRGPNDPVPDTLYIWTDGKTIADSSTETTNSTKYNGVVWNINDGNGDRYWRFSYTAYGSTDRRLKLSRSYILDDTTNKLTLRTP